MKEEIMYIGFANGKEIPFPKNIIEKIQEKILSIEGARNFQFFSNEAGIMCCINVSQICYITEKRSV